MDETRAEATQPTETELGPREVAKLVESDQTILIDVRQDYEWDAGRIAGARHIEVNELTAAADSIPRDETVVFYCRSGSRSGMAAHAFREAGWRTHNLAGGVIAWVEEGLELEPEGATVAATRPPTA